MDSKWPTLLLLVFGSVCVSAQDVSYKSSSKVSNFKSKLSRTELAAKPALSEPLQTGDDLDISSISDLGISVPPEDINDTVKTDHHFYYNSSFYTNPVEAKKFWINLDELPENIVISHDKLSDSYRQATTVELSFDFPFYGNPTRNVTIATGGFLYMGDYLHNWIAATQYVAPLMANFDTRMSTNSVIKYADNGTAFTVQWNKVHIQNRTTDGAFTFQVTLLKNGDIIFAYKDIPYPVSSISDSQHPVKVGLSDAYILERTVYFIRRKTVYEYNRIHITDWDISNNTALYFTALQTCNTFKDCTSCVSSGAKLACSWCEVIKRCSDGIDRQRQSWVSNGCHASIGSSCPVIETSTSDKTEISIVTSKETETSQLLPDKTSTSKSASSMYNVDNADNAANVDNVDSTHSNDVFEKIEDAAHLVHVEESSSSESGASPGAIATILVFLVAIVAASVWVFYAYKYPQSSSGQFLIKYRPSQWSAKKETTSAATTNSRHF